MIREALRRVLWLVPTLFVVTVPIFWALSRAMPSGNGNVGSLPLFFNHDPSDVRQLSLDAMTRVANGDPRAAAELVEKGGAALPHVLPRLDSLSSDGRRRVALALAPVARRMGIAQAVDLDTPESAILFWSSYWAEHSIDYRPLVVERAVRRLRDRASPPRRAEVRELDTFALEEVMSEMRPLETVADVDRVRPLCDAAAHATGRDAIIPKGASLETARRVVESWEDYWLENRSGFTTSEGARRLAAMLLETRYGRWAEHLVRRGLGRSKTGASIGDTVRARGPVTVSLVGAGLAGGALLSAFFALLGAARRIPLDRGIRIVVLALLGATGVGLASLVVSVFALRTNFGAALVMVLASAALSARHASVLEHRIGERTTWQHARAFGVPVLRSLLASLKMSAPSAIALAAVELPTALTLAFVVERAFSLPGLGQLTVDATQSSDMTWLMALAAIGTLLLGTAQIAADLALERLDPRPIVCVGSGRTGGH